MLLVKLISFSALEIRIQEEFGGESGVVMAVKKYTKNLRGDRDAVGSKPRRTLIVDKAFHGQNLCCW